MLNAWLPVVAYAALIFTLSSLPDLSPPGHVANSDKAAHLIEYGMLGWLLIRACRGSGMHPPARGVIAVALGLAVAAADEMYQGTVGRNRSLADAAADGLALVIVAVWDAWRSRRPGGRER